MTQRIQKAIDIFLDAINNGTLAKGTCVACAVGNLVAHGLKGTIKKTIDSDGSVDYRCDVRNDTWGWGFISDSEDKQAINDHYFNNEGFIMNVSATDFSVQELMKIENTFERNTDIYFTDYHLHTPEEIRADQIKGLESVVKVMLEFDQQQDDVKKVFTEKAQLITV